MTLKLKTVSMLLAMAALSMTACKRETLSEGGEKNPGVGGESGRVVHVSAAIALPSTASTRSGTQDSVGGSGNDLTNSDEDKRDNEVGGPQADYEYGYEYENDVRSMILLIASTADEYIAHSVISEINAEPTFGKKFDFMVNGEVKYEDLEAAYDEEKGGVFTGETYKDLSDDENPKVHIYVFCNYTGRLLDKLNEEAKDGQLRGKTEWLEWTGEVIEPASPAGQSPAISNTIWAPRSFLMTNAEVFTVEFPSDINGWDDYADKGHPYKLTGSKSEVEDNQDEIEDTDFKAIKVERAAARIDFRDGSEKGDFTYALFIAPEKTIIGEDGQVSTDKKSDQNLFNIELTRMALVNMSKEFYYMRRVSDDGTKKDWEILGREKSKNYVVDSDWDIKSKATAATGGYTAETAAGAFNFPLYNADASYNKDAWYADALKSVEEWPEDTWSGSANIGNKKPYHIWRYVTENTIPGELNQITVQSTGVVFKGAIVPGKDISAGFDDEDPTEEPYVSPAVQDALKAAALHLEYDENADNEITDWESAKKYNYPILYNFDGMLYADIDEVIMAAVQDGYNGTLYTAVTKILNQWKLGDDGFEYEEDIEEDDKVLTVDIYYAGKNYEAALEAAKSKDSFVSDDEFNKEYAAKYPGYDKIEDDMWGAASDATLFSNKFMELAPQYNFTLYKASDETDGEGWGYYCYYFYWNRHNDNGKSGEMGPMEFATVRNNVYKLSVTGINSFGHPRVTKYDPDPTKPDDPDEERLRYIQVQVEVLPWVVRVNDIEF